MKKVSRVLKTVDMSYGYAREVEPCYVAEQYYMLGDHNGYCPITIEVIEITNEVIEIEEDSTCLSS